MKIFYLIFIVFYSLNVVFAKRTPVGDYDVCPNLIKYEKSEIAQKDYLLNYNNKTFSFQTEKLLKNQINKTSFIFVTGLLSNLQKLTGKKNFDEIISGVNLFCWENKCKFDYLHSYNFHMSTSKTSQSNALIVKKMLEKIWKNKGFDRDIILVGHSKGGIDITQALVDMVPKLNEDRLSHIKVITISTPYGGSPLVDDVLNGFFSKKFFNLLMKVTGGSLSSLRDLSVKQRKIFLQKNCQKLQKLSNHYLSVGERYRGISQFYIGDFYSRILIPFKNILDTYDTENDGFVLLKDQKFGTFIKLPEESDHIGLVMPSAFPPGQGVVKVFKILVMMISKQ